MFHLPDRFKVGVKLALKDFIPKDMKPNDKKRIRDALKGVELEYQMKGEEIPSVNDEDYRCEVIQFYDFELNNIKDANYLASIYQNLIKPFCVLHMHDAKDEVYSFALKRLNQNDAMQIVVECSILTEKYPVGLPNDARSRLLRYLDYGNIKNRTNKINMYKEWYYRTYMLMNENAYANTERILEGNSWYDIDRMERLYTYYSGLVESRKLVAKVETNAEKMNLNKEIKTAIRTLDEELDRISK
jgi:hypothetical protein